MNPFQYEWPTEIEEAIALRAKDSGARYLGGGTNLLDLMKERVARPTALVDVSELTDEIREGPGGGLMLGASVKNADTANHRLVRERYPLLSKAILAGASFQIRNMASNGGNLCQRTRCSYFYELASPCNKRDPGAGCSAYQGINRQHAILGWTPSCVATYPGDMANALYCLDAVVKVRGPQGERSIPVNDFHKLAGETPAQDNVLQPSELILAIELPPSKLAQHYTYIKVRERSSYAFAMVAVAAGLHIEGATITQARITLGGVAHKPWRATAAEQALQGQPPSRSLFRECAELALVEARPLSHNAFKVTLAKNAIARALEDAAGPELIESPKNDKEASR